MEKDKIIIYNFTDPVCTWCLGMEPVFRKMELAFKEAVELRYICGGLVKDYREMADPFTGVLSENEKFFNRQVAKHWEKASERHGMPVKAEGFSLFSKEYPSTYPQNIAYKAALMASPKKADLFLYYMRTGVSSEGRLISREEVQLEIAGECGINENRFLTALRDGTAEAAFYEDLRLAARFGVSGFPSFLLEHGGVNYSLHGYQPYSVFERAIYKITEGRLLPENIERTEETLLSILEKHPKMAAEELRQVFDFTSQSEVKAWLLPFLESGKVRIKEAGNGWFVLKESEEIL